MASAGVEEVEEVDSPLGARRSKSGARLEYTEADAQAWAENFSHDHADPDLGVHLLLVDPTGCELQSAIEECADFLASGWKSNGVFGAHFDFAFSGHGDRSGMILLRDEPFPAKKILTDVAQGVPRDQGAVKCGVVLDCCYATSGLVKLMLAEADTRTTSLRDGFAASLHDEEAFEYPELGHGLLTYVLMNSSPFERTAQLLSTLLDRGAWSVQADGRLLPTDQPLDADLKDLIRDQLINKDMIAYLSGGKQHAVDVMNRRVISLSAHGHFDYRDTTQYWGTVSAPVHSVDVFAHLEDLTRQEPDYGLRLRVEQDD